MDKEIACQTTLEYIDEEQRPIPLTPIKVVNHSTTPQNKQRSMTVQQRPQQQSPKIQNHIEELKSQIMLIASQFDDVINRGKIKKQQRQYQTPPDLLEKQNIIKGQMIEINSIKTKVTAQQRKLEISLEDKEVTKLEDKLRYLSELEKQLQQEHDSLIKIHQRQKNVLIQCDQNELQQIKLERLSQLRLEKQTMKQLQEQIRQLETHSRNIHEGYYKQVEKLRWIDNKVQEFNKKKHKIIIRDDLEILTNQLQELQNETELKNGQYISKVKELERERKRLTVDVEARERQLKEKDKELKLTLLKYNEQRIQKNYY